MLLGPVMGVAMACPRLLGVFGLALPALWDAASEVT